MVVLKKITLLFLLCLFLLPVRAQEFQPTPAQRGVRTSGDVAVGMLAAAGLTAVLVQKDWQGLKQGALSGVTTLGVTYALKYLVKKERPDHSDFHSFPSMHTSAVFTAAAFIQRRYGWKWGAPGIRPVGLCRLDPCVRKEARLVGCGRGCRHRCGKQLYLYTSLYAQA